MGYDDVAKRWQVESLERRLDSLEERSSKAMADRSDLRWKLFTTDMKATMAIVYLVLAVVLGCLLLWSFSSRLPPKDDGGDAVVERQIEVEAGPGR
jgi:hypothetical protein